MRPYRIHKKIETGYIQYSDECTLFSGRYKKKLDNIGDELMSYIF